MPGSDTLLQAVELGSNLQLWALSPVLWVECGVAASQSRAVSWAEEGVCSDHGLGWAGCWGREAAEPRADWARRGWRPWRVAGQAEAQGEDGPLPGALWERALSFLSLSLATRG